MTAFVGPSGAGKTTVFSLIERFYEATSGRVLVDGRDVTDWPLAELRAAIGYVEQDAPVLSGTLGENLLLGAPRPARTSWPGCWAPPGSTARWRGCPMGWTPWSAIAALGCRAGSASGWPSPGPCCVIPGCCRWTRSPPAGAVNEAALRDTIAAAARVTTVLVVAHRLSTVTMADGIVVIDAGSVRAVGTHAELLGTDPLYAEQAATQFLVPAD
jgi:ABC-type branched-subunit amino acid transport system ATPase component